MAWTSNHIALFYGDEITYPYPNPDAGLANLSYQKRSLCVRLIIWIKISFDIRVTYSKIYISFIRLLWEYSYLPVFSFWSSVLISKEEARSGDISSSAARDSAKASLGRNKEAATTITKTVFIAETRRKVPVSVKH